MSIRKHRQPKESARCHEISCVYHGGTLRCTSERKTLVARRCLQKRLGFLTYFALIVRVYQGALIAALCSYRRTRRLTHFSSSKGWPPLFELHFFPISFQLLCRLRTSFRIEPPSDLPQDSLLPSVLTILSLQSVPSCTRSWRAHAVHSHLIASGAGPRTNWGRLNNHKDCGLLNGL